LMLYCTLVRSKLEYASVAWNSITSTDASKLERIQRKFVSLCHRRFFSHLPYSYVALNHLEFHTLSDRRCHLDALFLLNVYNGSKFCPTLLETFGLRVPDRNFRDFKLFHVDLNRRNCPSARCASAANAISRIFVYWMVGLFWLMICYWCKYWIRRCSSVTATFLKQVIYVLSGIGFCPSTCFILFYFIFVLFL
jgi:hypothetical protein